MKKANPKAGSAAVAKDRLLWCLAHDSRNEPFYGTWVEDRNGYFLFRRQRTYIK